MRFETLPAELTVQVRWLMQCMFPALPRFFSTDVAEDSVAVGDVAPWWNAPRDVLFHQSLAEAWCEPEWLEVCADTLTKSLSALAVDLPRGEAA